MKSSRDFGIHSDYIIHTSIIWTEMQSTIPNSSEARWLKLSMRLPLCIVQSPTTATNSTIFSWIENENTQMYQRVQFSAAKHILCTIERNLLKN